MTKRALKTAKDYADWERKNDERKQRLLEEELPFESADPKERERWDAAFEERRLAARKWRDEVLDANGKELAEGGVDNVFSGDTFTLTKAQPLVNMIALGWQINPKWQTAGPSLARYFDIPKVVLWGTPPELVVNGLGEYSGKRRARVAPLEMTAFDLSNRIVERLGITGDERLTLPNPAARVLFVLKDPKRGAVTVTLNRENALYRGDQPAPKDWLVHKWWKEPKGAYD